MREELPYVGKTREMIVDFQRRSDQPESVVFEGESMERVLTYIYKDLGVLFDNTRSAGSRIVTIF